VAGVELPVIVGSQSLYGVTSHVPDIVKRSIECDFLLLAVGPPAFRAVIEQIGFASVFRPVMPFVAGAARMPYGRFLAFNAPAGLVWAAVFVGLGFWAGEEWRAVARWVDRAGWVFIVGVVVGLGAKWLKGRRRRRVDLCPVSCGRRIESIMEQA
jgi:hypothetical protein